MLHYEGIKKKKKNQLKNTSRFRRNQIYMRIYKHEKHTT